jgi:hypothetical protein
VSATWLCLCEIHEFTFTIVRKISQRNMYCVTASVKLRNKKIYMFSSRDNEEGFNNLIYIRLKFIFLLNILINYLRFETNKIFFSLS